MSIHQSRLSRRTILRGLGVSLALPMLESIAPKAVAASPTLGPPQRMAFIFVPNGVHLPDWTPKQQGVGFDLPHILGPLAPVQDDLMVISGLTHDKGRANGDGAGDHARSASVFLTGAQPRKTSGENIRSGVSVDQVAAQAAGQATRFASLELGCEAGRSAGNCDSGYSCAYSSNVSWSSDSMPVAKETNPRLVFERLFGDGTAPKNDANAKRRDELKKSVLDFISDDARSLQSKLGGNDKHKLEEYLSGVREVERRIQRSDDEPKLSVDVDYPIPKGTPSDYGEHIRLMCDMMVMAFQTDRTRIATCMLADAGSNRSYRHINIAEGHHDLSHHRGEAEKHAKIREINRFHVAQLAYFLQKLKSTPDGEGNLLDNSMICYGSAISDGNRHNNEDLPVLLAGRAGGQIDSGRHIHVARETPMCNLFMSMLDRFGTPVDFVGDSTGRVSELTI
ncbi:hypothetical protein K227x_03850 [Rubripirellula lacrimiformis]|uniref:Secreted protein containing DUF1552 n=1 Tax=Rubripirellula lacrimiformis TaxID=1930273 RepID=A0A517N4F5_9BACT|nr:DUF1552 domain-containing protein [Rubripirellula lacrimiformis]QDT02014.1 hypothetical protein K227x_03850 [Rubripirellula lacrimiformis]